MFSRAIAETLLAPPAERADLFARLARRIADVTTAPGSGMRPWTCTEHVGIDGSRVFRGGLGASLVVDPTGRLWRARNVEDFETQFTITANSCEIASLTPLYGQMREYLPRPEDGPHGHASEAMERSPGAQPVNLPPTPGR